MPVGAADPADAYTRTGREILCGSIHHNSDNLMTRDESFTTWAQFAFDDVQVRPAKATCTYAEEHIAGHELRLWDFNDLKRTLGNVLR